MGEILMQRSEATAARRRVYFDLRDATDGITPETGEDGGQPQHTDPLGITSFALTGTATPDITETYQCDRTQLYGLRPVYRATAGLLWYCWYDTVGATWVFSSALGTKGAGWYTTAGEELTGELTAQGTATGTLTLGSILNGPVWTAQHIGTLNHLGYGRYYAELDADAIDTAGERIETRYKSANTADTPGSAVRVVNFDPDNIPQEVFTVDLDQVEAAAPTDSLCCLVLMAMHSNTRDNAGKITVYRTDDTTEFAQLDYTTDANAYPIDGVS